MTEEYFPRGGKKPNVTYFKQSGNFLGAAEQGQGKKKKEKKKSENDDGYLSDEAVKEVDQSYKMCAAGIGLKTIKTGVNVLGRVRKVLETKLLVSLPSRLEGTVMACHISEPYNKMLEAYVNDEIESVRALGELFRPGQYVALQVLEAAPDLLLSAMPAHVGAARSLRDLHKGDILQAAVSSVEDHGYVMDVGIPDARAFLSKKDANPEIELDTGMLTWTCVKSHSADSGVVSLSGALASLQTALRRKRAGALLPGTAVEFVVDKPLENGIKGHIFGDTTAYVQRFHADHVKGKKPKLGQKIRAHVLYVMPTRNAPFLLMRNIFESSHPDLQTEMKFHEGDIIEEAQVLKIASRSIHFKLGRGCTGTMSLRRVAVHEDLSDEQVIAQSYPIGSSHRVRVLAYNQSDYIYHVSDQTALLTERFFSLDQLRAGQTVSGSVRGVSEKYVTVSVGRLSGYVPLTHLWDAGVYVDPKNPTNSKLTKKKYKVGQEVTARVLSVDPGKQTLFLTLKPSLVAPAVEPLTAYEEACVGKTYTGFIKVLKDFLLVGFFSDVVAYVPRDQVCRPVIQNLHEAFHLGQIVNCTIMRVDAENKKMMGSLITPAFWPAKTAPKPDKRKQNAEDSEVPKKKRKSDDIEETDAKKKKKKHDKNSDIAKEVSEETDAIDTDIHEESDEVLTPEDKVLINLSDCVTEKQWKKRVASLRKSVNCRVKRIERIEKKILNIEETGLTPMNKKFHTLMHQDKLVVEERLKQLRETLETAQEKLKELGIDGPSYLKRKEKKKLIREEKLKKKETLALNKNLREKAVEDDDQAETEVPEVKKKKKDKVKVKETPNEEDVPEKQRKGKTLKEKQKKHKEVNEVVVDKSKEIQVVESLQPALVVPSAKDFWAENAENLTNNATEQSSTSEDEETEQPKKKRKKLSAAEKVAKARAEEERLRELERRAAASDAAPRSSEQFERALMASPDCSQLWVAYMACHLQAAEIDKARAVGRKALNTISFREEQEKLNVWLAMLNCEHRFGTKETQQKILEEALQYNDTFKVHSALLEILVDTCKPQELASLVELMMRKYRRAAASYAACGAACYRQGLLDKARQVMQKAVAVLEKKEHVSLLVQFALLERAHGERERAEALFEQLLAVYPARVDVCAAYVDMLVRSGATAQARQVMERLTSQKLPARKMKVLYNKWVEIEERAGDPEQAEKIRQRAVQFIEKAKF